MTNKKEAFDLESLITLLTLVVEQCGIKKKSSIFSAADRRTVLKALKTIDKPLTDAVLKQYAYAARGLKQPGYHPETEKLSNLCALVNEGYWEVFSAKQRKLRGHKTIKEERSFRQFKEAQTAVSAVYQQKEFTTIHLGDLKQLKSPFRFDSFYIGLRYLDAKILNQTIDLKVKEKEQFRQLFRESVFEVSSELTEPALAENERVIIIGNPGTGKSVFARFLCWQWSQTQNRQEKLYLHIPLRALDYKTDRRALIHYINQRYFLQKTESWLSNFLLIHSEQVIYVLDGYDELENARKSQLTDLLTNITPNHRFILLSRPYGLINQDVFADAVLEIPGFDTYSRQLFLERALTALYSNRISPKAVKEIFSDNAFLIDVSYNPLMLSYIVLLCGRQDGMSILRKVRSVFQLNEEFMFFLKGRYEQKHPELSIDFDKMLKSSSKLAFHMEISQMYIYDGTGSQDPYYLPSIDLNRAGLGRNHTTNNGADWKFIFNSASEQEFLASQYIVPRCSVKVIMTLLEDSFYWNLVKAIAGGLVLRKREHVILAVLEELQKKFTDKGHISDQIFYWVILAESTEAFVKSLMTSERASRLVDVVFNNLKSPLWNSILEEVCRKLREKVPVAIETHLMTKLLDRLKMEASLSTWLNVLKVSRIFNFNHRLKYLKRYLQALNQLKEEHNEITRIERPSPQQATRRNYILPVLKFALNQLSTQDTATILLIKNELAFLLLDLPKGLEDERDKLNQSIDRVNSFAYEELIKSKSIWIKANSTSTHQANEDALLASMGTYLIEVIQHSSPANEKEVEEIKQTVNDTIDILYDHTVQNDSDFDEQVAEKILKDIRFSSKQLKLKLLLLLGDNFIIAGASVSLPTVCSAIDTCIKDYKTSSNNLKPLKTLVNLLKVEDVGYRAYPIYINTLFDLTVDLIMKNKELYARLLVKFLNEDYDDFSAYPETKWLLEYVAFPKFNFEKRLLASKFFESEINSLDIVRKFVIPQIIGRGHSFHDHQTWVIVRSLIDGPDSFVNVLNILETEGLYYFEHNLSEIDQTITCLIENYTQQTALYTHHKHFLSQSFLIVRAIFYTSRLISTSKKYTNWDHLCYILKEFLMLDPVITYLHNPAELEEELQAFLLAPLFLYHLIQDEDIAALISSSGLFNSEHRIQLSNEVIGLLFEVISHSELVNYQGLLSESFLKESENYLKEHTYTCERVTPEHIQTLMNNE